VAFYDTKKFHAACCRCADCGTSLNVLTYREADDGAPLCKIHHLYRKKGDSEPATIRTPTSTGSIAPGVSTVEARKQQWSERVRLAAEQREKEKREMELILKERRLRRELQGRQHSQQEEEQEQGGCIE
jgi:hypothetical protein